jgi:hypothetical protein
VRVRVREGRAAKSVLDFNLYLSPNDAWAAGDRAHGRRRAASSHGHVVHGPVFTAGSGSSSLDFRNNLYTGSLGDGFGDTLDRTREGYIEVIEMATLTDESRAYVDAQLRRRPGQLRRSARPMHPLSRGPTAGLSGDAHAHQVASGMDFT